MLVKILHESDLSLALMGLGFSYGLTSGMTYEEFCLSPGTQEHLYEIAIKLSHLGKGHNKFLESIQVWLDIITSRYVWQDLSTYRVGISTQSESTNHTILKRPFIQDDFEDPIPEHILVELNTRRENKDFLGVKAILPESFLQRRIVCTNYKTLQNIYQQRITHKLPQFQVFCNYLLDNVRYPMFLKKDAEVK